MDNRRIDVVSEGHGALHHAIAVAWAGKKATHYKVMKLAPEVVYYGDPKTTHHIQQTVECQTGAPTLVFLWGSSGPDAIPLLFPLTAERAPEFVEGWLANNPPHGKPPDHDGDNGHGWRIFTDAWGYVAGNQYAIAAIQPVWATYGK